MGKQVQPRPSAGVNEQGSGMGLHFSHCGGREECGFIRENGIQPWDSIEANEWDWARRTVFL